MEVAYLNENTESRKQNRFGKKYNVKELHAKILQQSTYPIEKSNLVQDYSSSENVSNAVPNPKVSKSIVQDASLHQCNMSKCNRRFKHLKNLYNHQKNCQKKRN